MLTEFHLYRTLDQVQVRSMRMFRKHAAVTVAMLALVLAFGLPALVGDGTGNYPDVREEILDDVFSGVRVCRDNPIQRLYTLRSRLVYLAYTEIPVEERKPFVIPSPLPALLYVPPTYTIENAIVRHFSFFAIPFGWLFASHGPVGPVQYQAG